MSQFIQCLESRTLLSATFTKEMVLADQMSVIADVTAARASFKAVASGIAADTRTIAADLKSLATPDNRKANAGLLKTLRTDEHKRLATLRADSARPLGMTTSATHRAAAHALALLAHPTDTKLAARVAADVMALTSATADPLTKLQADLQALTLDTDLTNIANANPTGTQLAADIATAQANQTAAIAASGAAATKVQTDAGTLANDLGSSPTGSNSNLVGTYNGTATSTTGNRAGQVSTIAITITSESATGALSGSADITRPNASPVTDGLTGMVGTNGSFSVTVSDNAGDGATLTGTASATMISGTFASLDGTDGGTFSATR